MSRVSIVVATDRRGVIGRDGQLPWHLPADLKRFRTLTMGKPIVMGRRTWDSIGRPLPGRRSIVVSRTPGLDVPGADVATSFEGALAAAGDVPEICVIGGAEIFRMALPIADMLHLTLVDAEVEGDVHFPPIDRQQWRELAREEHCADSRHAWPYAFITLERERPS